MACLLLSQNLTPDQIDREFAIYLVRITSNMQEIADILGMGLVQAREFFRSISNFDYNETRNQF